jgi:hypothetical protein
MCCVNSLLKNFDLAKIIVSHSQGVTRLTGINGIRSKIKSGFKHIKAASWGKKFWNLSHQSILVNTHEFG